MDEAAQRGTVIRTSSPDAGQKESGWALETPPDQGQGL